MGRSRKSLPYWGPGFESQSLRQILLRKIWRDLAILQSKMADPPTKSSTIMYYVYILLNEKKTRTYTGAAKNVEKRLKEILSRLE